MRKVNMYVDSKIIKLVTIANLFPFEVVQRCQHYQLGEIRGNATTDDCGLLNSVM